MESGWDVVAQDLRLGWHLWWILQSCSALVSGGSGRSSWGDGGGGGGGKNSRFVEISLNPIHPHLKKRGLKIWCWFRLVEGLKGLEGCLLDSWVEGILFTTSMTMSWKVEKYFPILAHHIFLLSILFWVLGTTYVWISIIFLSSRPQVTLAVMLAGRGKLTKANAAKYVLAQIVAALLAGLVPGSIDI